jgi:SAM-dependent MidA family methyltransferase
MNATKDVFSGLLAQGKINFSTYMEYALYHPQNGYYASKANYPEDFITAPIHANYLARAISQWFKDIGVEHVAELGPGLGHLARDIVNMSGEELKAYYLLDRAVALRDHQSKYLSSPQFKLIQSLTEHPIEAVIANEVLDAIPTRRFKYSHSQVFEWFLDTEGQEVWQQCAPPPEIEPHLSDWPDGYEFEITNYQQIMSQFEHSEVQHILWIDYGYEADTYFHPMYPASRMKYIAQHQHVAFDAQDLGQVDISTTVNWSGVSKAASRYGFEIERFGTLADFMHFYRVHEYIDMQEQSAVYDFKETMIPGGLGETMQVLWLKKTSGIV